MQITFCDQLLHAGKLAVADTVLRTPWRADKFLSVQGIVVTFGNHAPRPIWQQHLIRESDLFEQLQQAKETAVQSNPLYHPLLMTTSLT